MAAGNESILYIVLRRMEVGLLPYDVDVSTDIKKKSHLDTLRS